MPQRVTTYRTAARRSDTNAVFAEIVTRPTANRTAPTKRKPRHGQTQEAQTSRRGMVWRNYVPKGHNQGRNSVRTSSSPSASTALRPPNHTAQTGEAELNSHTPTLPTRTPPGTDRVQGQAWSPAVSLLSLLIAAVLGVVADDWMGWRQ